jgi:hypothetical protein
MCSHYLIEPTACTPASGWEKGQVENQVNVVRERFFKPRLRFATYAEMNAWLLERCVAYAKAQPHPECRDSPVWDVFEAERPRLVPYVGRFDGFHAKAASVSKTCLVQFDKNKYSVMSQAVGRPVEVYAYAERIVIRQDGRIVADHLRCFGREQTIQGLGVARRRRAAAAEAEKRRGRRPADDQNPDRCAGRRYARGRSSLRRGAQRRAVQQ